MFVNDQKDEVLETNETIEKTEDEQSEVQEESNEEKTEVKEEEKKEEKKELSTDDFEEDMESLLDEHFKKFEQGKIVEGIVISVDERSVLVDIGFKSESAISIREFSNSNLPEAGSKIKVYIDSVEDGIGRLRLSKKKADFYLNLEKLEKIMGENQSVTGILRRRVKGGMIVDLENLEAFLPGSQISTKPIPNLDQFIGKETKFKIIKIDKDRRNIIVSRKQVLIEEQQSRLEGLKKEISEGAELDGEVRNITDYGAFIDLGGIDGLLHITDMSWGHIKHPSDMLNIGDKVKVRILKFDIENEKVSLGLKQLVPHPWENIETKYPEGTIVSGKVVNITNYGAFVELESGVEGLVHVSEMSWTKKIKHPKQMFKKGDSIKAIVLSTSKEERRISLGVKQMEANPWFTIEDRYPVGTKIKGIVRSITPFGVFVEIEEDIEGLIHISDISWTKRIYHPKEVLKKGDKLDVKVLSIDKTLHRIALGIKQLQIDPWDNLDQRLPINTEVKAKIVKIIAKGVLVDVSVDEDSVEGFIPLSHLAIPGLKKAGMAFEIDEELPLKVIELDLENRRLILSVKAYFFARDKNEFNEFVEEHQKRVNKKSEKRKAIKENLVNEEKKESKKEIIEKTKDEAKTKVIEETIKVEAEVKQEEPVSEEVLEGKVEEVKTEIETEVTEDVVKAEIEISPDKEKSVEIEVKKTDAEKAENDKVEEVIEEAKEDE
ncbi:MAG: 30S ribosomal protein S1 [Candidatus Tenebribacter burtonii]|nr:30S ribosomal protein S1 [Candidatus Tenebribacter burtonii]